jgi:hypothetical protein
MASFGLKKTLARENQACITCPVFNVESKISACLALRDELWKGKRLDVRRGCQAALTDSKCPVYHLVKHMERTDDDPIHSTEPKTLPWPKHILERIAPVQVQGRTMDKFGVSDRERELLTASNDMKAAVPRTKASTTRLEDVKAPEKPAASKPVKDDAIAAATAGDMSAAINAAAQTPQNKPVEAAPVAEAPKPQPKPATPPVTAPAAGTTLSLLERARLARQQQSAA